MRDNKFLARHSQANVGSNAIPTRPPTKWPISSPGRDTTTNASLRPDPEGSSYSIRSCPRRSSRWQAPRRGLCRTSRRAPFGRKRTLDPHSCDERRAVESRTAHCSRSREASGWFDHYYLSEQAKDPAGSRQSIILFERARSYEARFAAAASRRRQAPRPRRKIPDPVPRSTAQYVASSTAKNGVVSRTRNAA
jgi:hypothetical protein